MRLLTASALGLTLLIAGAATAATPPAPKAAPAAATKVSATKMKTCGAKWKAEKKHTATKKDFMASCEKA